MLNKHIGIYSKYITIPEGWREGGQSWTKRFVFRNSEMFVKKM